MKRSVLKRQQEEKDEEEFLLQLCKEATEAPLFAYGFPFYCSMDEVGKLSIALDLFGELSGQFERISWPLQNKRCIQLTKDQLQNVREAMRRTILARHYEVHDITHSELSLMEKREKLQGLVEQYNRG